MSAPPTVMPPTPPGLEALYSLCQRIYPNQRNPLQVTALVKYWLGGPDPLDYISMYSHPGDPVQNIPPHWHYISFGLSDLHGDGRVHEVSTSETPSGFGFELTFRLKQEPGETAPPTWPAALMQSLAKYVFQSGNTLCAGDHVSWHSALDGSESRIQHMLMNQDPALGSIQTPLGTVAFVQIVGVCREELQAAQRWNGVGVIDILKRLNGAGGPWLVTDMRRGESMLEIDVSVLEEVERGLENDGSNLSGVSARCSWVEADAEHLSANPTKNASKGNEKFMRDESLVCPISNICSDRSHEETPMPPTLSGEERNCIKAELQKGLYNRNKDLRDKISASFDNNGNTCRKDDLEGDSPSVLESTELLRIKRLDGLQLTFNLEAGLLLPLAIRGRVMHGRHFTFKSVLGDTAITFVAPSVTGTLVDVDSPYMAHGPWLQVLIPEDLAKKMSETFECLNNDEVSLPKTFVWKDHKLVISIVHD